LRRRAPRARQPRPHLPGGGQLRGPRPIPRSQGGRQARALPHRARRAPRREGVRGRGPLVHGTGRHVDGPPPQPPPSRLLRARGRGRLAADPRLLRPAPGQEPRAFGGSTALVAVNPPNAQPVAAISTAQGAWWLSLLGTLPSTNR